MNSRLAAFVAASALFVPLVLLLDGEGILRQLALGIATASFVWYFVRRMDVPPLQIACAILVATAGELILSTGLGLYEYRFSRLPLYVPAGHGVFYLLAVVTARQPWLISRGRIITTFTVAAGSIGALIALAMNNDQLGFVWWVLAAVILLRSRHGLVISSCILYTSLLEYLGTALGNWHWAPNVHCLGLGAGNPPAGVGILYITLDVIVIALTRQVPIPSLEVTRESSGVS